MNSLKMTLGRERREDLNHGDWDDPVTEVVDADERPPGSPPQSTRRSMADAPPLDAGSPQPDQVTPGTTGSWDVVEGEDNGLGHFLAQPSDQDDSYQLAPQKHPGDCADTRGVLGQPHGLWQVRTVLCQG